MQLSDIITEDLVAPDLGGATRDEVIDELIDVLVFDGSLPAELRESAAQAVRQREASQTTGLGAGVAIPHGIAPGLDEVVAALGIHRGGVDFAAVDGQPVHLIVLLVVPPNRFQAHIRTLAGIARLLNDSSLRRRIVGASSAHEVMEVLLAGEQALGGVER